MGIFIVLILLFILLLISEWWLKKKYRIETHKGFFYKWVNKIHLCIEIALLIVFGVVIWFVEIYNFSIVIPFFFVLFIFRTIMEWKYNREKKIYIITFLYSIFYFVVFGMLLYIILYYSKGIEIIRFGH